MKGAAKFQYHFVDNVVIFWLFLLLLLLIIVITVIFIIMYVAVFVIVNGKNNCRESNRMKLNVQFVSVCLIWRYSNSIQVMLN